MDADAARSTLREDIIGADTQEELILLGQKLDMLERL